MLVRPALRIPGEASPAGRAAGLPLLLASATSGTLGGLLLPDTVGSAKEMRSALFLRCIWAVMEPLLGSTSACAGAGDPGCAALPPSTATATLASGAVPPLSAARPSSEGCTLEPEPGLPSGPSALDSLRIMLLLLWFGQGLQDHAGGGRVNSGRWVAAAAGRGGGVWMGCLRASEAFQPISGACSSM